ncbi:MAG TPA: Uma2 family endonuclease [Chloroflexota bacterium]|jgi:Uma2 family endonuclease
MAIEVKTRLTPADIERMVASGELSQDEFWEFVNGEIVWLAPAHHPQGVICMRIGSKLVPFADEIRGLVFDGQAGFWVGNNFQQLRAPDVSLVTRERRHIVANGTFSREAPDLAIEVLSDEQFGRAYAVTKLDEYFAAGAKAVWFVDYRDSSVHEHLSNRAEHRIYHGDAEITLDTIAPGFRCRVSEFFPED